MKKKVLAFLLVAVIVVGMLPFTVSAIEDCGHNNWKIYSNMKKDGYGFCQTCKIKCYHDGTQSISLTDCTSGFGTTTCTVCGWKYMGSNLVEAKPAHEWENGTCKNCTKKHDNHSFENFVCTVCGLTDPSYVPCTEHNWKNSSGECTNENCHESHTHDYVTNKPICGSENYVNETCSICGYVGSIGQQAPANHNFEDGKCTFCGTDEPAPCEHEWGPDGMCLKNCGATCPHDESELAYRNCVESQYDHMVCKACGVITNPAVAKDRTTHTYGEGDKCTYCGADKPEEDCNHEWDRLDGNCDKCGEAHDHNYQDIIPNCTQGGYLSQHCEGCGHTIVGNAVEKKNHNYGADGVCTVCGNVKSECAHEWNWATGQCEKCLEFHIHSDADITIDHPNCTEGGYIREICDVCGYILVKGHFTASEHEYVNGICIRCGDVEPVVPEEVEQTEEETPKKASTEGLDDVPQTGSIFLEWLYNLIFG